MFEELLLKMEAMIMDAIEKMKDEQKKSLRHEQAKMRQQKDVKVMYNLNDRDLKYLEEYRGLVGYKIGGVKKYYYLPDLELAIKDELIGVIERA